MANSRPSLVARSLGLLTAALTVVGCQNRSSSTSAPQAISFAQFAALDTEGNGNPRAPESADCTSLANDAGTGSTCRELRQEFRYVVYVGKQIYAYWDMKKAETGTDYDQLALQLEAKINDKMALQQYFRDVLRPWAASLHDGHVNAMPGDDLSKLDLVTTNIRLRAIAAGTDHEKVVVATSKVSQVPVKTQILKVNGEPVQSMVDRYEALASGSTKAMRRLSATATLLDRIGSENASEPLNIEIQTPGESAPKTVSLDRVLELNLPPDKDAKEEKDPTGEAQVQARILRDQIGYLKIDGFMGTKLRQIFDRLMSQLRSTKGLIIDLRANGGGDMSGDNILRWLTPTNIVRYQVSPKNADFLVSQRPEYFLLPGGNEAGFFGWTDKSVSPTSPTEGSYANKPVVALIGPRCFSACDTFSAALKANGLAKFVGENTAGGTGTPLVFELPVSKFRFRYSVVRGKTANGEWIEGKGTAPDVPLEYSIDDLSKEPYADTQAMKALEILSTSSTTTPSRTIVSPTSPDGSFGTELTTRRSVENDSSALKQELLQLQLSDRFHE